jgi:ribonuclease BN (tRNA processing enzyme)
LVCEIAHFPPETLFEFLSSRKVKRLLLTHASEEVVTNSEAVLTTARKLLTQTEVSYAADRERLELNRYI